MELVAKQNNKLLLKNVCHPSDANVLEAAGYEYNPELDRTDANGDTVETWSNARFLECLFDVTCNIQYDDVGAGWIADDSRSAFQLAIWWAREFFETFTPEMDAAGEYLERIDAFTAEKIKEEQQ